MAVSKLAKRIFKRIGYRSGVVRSVGILVLLLCVFVAAVPSESLAQYVVGQTCVNSSTVNVSIQAPTGIATNFLLCDHMAQSCRGNFSAGQIRTLSYPAGGSYPQASWFYSYQYSGHDQWTNGQTIFSFTVRNDCVAPTAALYVRNVTTNGSWTSGNPTIAPGDEIAFQWSTANAASCSGTNVTLSGTSGTQTTVTEPTAGTSRTYTLSCTGSKYGSVSRSITVTTSATPTCSISLSPNPLYQGESSTLTWSSANATSFYIQNVGYVNSLGSTSVAPSADTSYTGTVSGPGGSASCSGTQDLTVYQYCPFNGQNIAHGSSVTAYQSATMPYGSSCVSQVRSCSNGTLSGSYQYSGCTVDEVPPPPSGSISVAPATVPLGTIATVTWSSDGADSCTVTGGGNSWSGTSGEETTNTITGEVTFTLACENAGGPMDPETVILRTAPRLEEI